jgi:hypothetical protein
MTIEPANPPITINVEPATLPVRDVLGGGEFFVWISEVFMISPTLSVCHSEEHSDEE